MKKDQPNLQINQCGETKTGHDSGDSCKKICNEEEQSGGLH